MKLKKLLVMVTLALGLCLPVAAFELADVHYWVGEGTNRCGVIIDWGAKGGSRAWGYRWSGTCTNLSEVVRRIVWEDPRLVANAQQTFFGYDVNDIHPTWCADMAWCSDLSAYVAVNTAESEWMWSAGPQTVPQDGAVYMLTYGGGSGPSQQIVPAETPYGFEVLEEESETDENGPLYGNFANVLGHPTMGIFSSSAQYGDSGSTINPAYPAWSGGRLLTLKSGSVVIRFDHKVRDDPANPFGIDLLVFGNAFAVRSNLENVTLTTDPKNVRFNGAGAAEPAFVEVSPDGVTWYGYEDGPYADDYMPTLGYCYDPEDPDPALFAGNRYWGRSARATRPVDPRRTFADFNGCTLAEICQRYNGSAGGTGFDLALARDGDGNPLPVDKELGVRWIQYVRISSMETDEPNQDGDNETQPEVDAVADVAPVSQYEKWVEANYTNWNTAWDPAVSGTDAIAANGKANGVNFVLGLQANETSEALNFTIAEFVKGETTHTLVMMSNKPMTDSAGLVVKGCETLGQWTKSELPVLESSELVDGLYRNVFKVSADCGQFFRLSLEVE